MSKAIPRVLIFWPFSNWSLSGVCTFCENLVRFLPDFDHRIHLIRVDDPTISVPQDLSLATFPSFDAYNAFLESAEPAIVVNSFSWRLSHMARVRQHRYVQIIQSHDPYYYFPLKLSLNRWHAVVGVSRRIVESVTHLGGQAELISNGVAVGKATREKPRPTSKIHLLYAGRLVEVQKRVSRLVQIAQALRKIGVPFDLRIVGDGVMEPWLKRFFTNEEMPGRVAASEMGEYYRWAHFFILPSDFEGESLALLEALANGCVPVMGCFESDAAERLDELGIGYRGKTEGMIDFLASFQSDSERWESQSGAARRFFEKSDFRMDAVASRYRNLFNEIGGMPPMIMAESSAKRVILKIYTKLIFSRLRRLVTKISLFAFDLK